MGLTSAPAPFCFLQPGHAWLFHHVDPLQPVLFITLLDRIFQFHCCFWRMTWSCWPHWVRTSSRHWSSLQLRVKLISAPLSEAVASAGKVIFWLEMSYQLKWRSLSVSGFCSWGKRKENWRFVGGFEHRLLCLQKHLAFLLNKYVAALDCSALKKNFWGLLMLKVLFHECLKAQGLVFPAYSLSLSAL